MIEHTPGPWHVVVTPDQDGWNEWNLYGVYDSDGKLIFERVIDFRREEKRAMSDARLAAAAPEMYETLYKIYDDAFFMEVNDIQSMALQTIEKAEGRDE